MTAPKSTSRVSKKTWHKRRTTRILLAVIVVLIAIRLILPYVALRFINERLANLSGYFGHVEDLDLSLYRGAYIVKDLYIDKVDSLTEERTQLLNCPLIDISVEWKSLFKGRIVSELEFESPTLRFTEDHAEPAEMDQDTTDFRKMLKTFTPLSVNRFEIFNGTLAYLDNTVTPVVDIELANTHILARNLSNVVDTTLLPANIQLTANAYNGAVTGNMRIDALAEDPTFDMNMEIKDADLTRLNDFFKAYAKFDINKGTFGLYMEIAAREKKYIGYVKPFLADLDVAGPEDRKDSFFHKIWEGIVGLTGNILENNETDRIATKIPLVGEYGEQTIGVWYAILATLRNGFIQAIYPALDYQVTIGTVTAVNPAEENKEGIFRKVFGKPGERKDDKKKDKKN